MRKKTKMAKTKKNKKRAYQKRTGNQIGTGKPVEYRLTAGEFKELEKIGGGRTRKHRTIGLRRLIGDDMIKLVEKHPLTSQSAATEAYQTNFTSAERHALKQEGNIRGINTMGSMVVAIVRPLLNARKK